MTRSLRRFAAHAFAFATLLWLPALAAAQLHNIDIILRVQQQRVETGRIDPDTGLPVFPERVFVTSFGSNGSVADPGFDAEPFALPDGSNVGFDFAGAVRLWNGSDFGTLATPRIRARFGPLQACSPDGDAAAPGFGVAVENGLYHHHFTYTLASTCSPLAVSSAPGVYLLAMTIWCDAPGVQSSDPLYLIIGRGAAQADLDAAASQLRSTLAQASCRLDYNRDGTLNPDDIGDFITDYFTSPPPPGPGGYAIGCGDNPPPYDAGYKAGYTSDGAGTCGTPNPDNLGDWITDYFLGC